MGRSSFTGPRLTWRLTGSCFPAIRRDVAATRYRRPLTSRSKMYTYFSYTTTRGKSNAFRCLRLSRARHVRKSR